MDWTNSIHELYKALRKDLENSKQERLLLSESVGTDRNIHTPLRRLLWNEQSSDECLLGFIVQVNIKYTLFRE